MFESLNHITQVPTSNTLHQVLNGVVTVANIGDSRIIAVESKDNTHVKGVDISHDHKPDLPSEKERIERRGGRVFAIQYDDGGPLLHVSGSRIRCYPVLPCLDHWVIL